MGLGMVAAEGCPTMPIFLTDLEGITYRRSWRIGADLVLCDAVALPCPAEETRVPTKILVVDDSATMRRVLQMTFAGEDAQVIAVESGDAGAAKAGEMVPDVVFADASMQGVDGYELA